MGKQFDGDEIKFICKICGTGNDLLHGVNFSRDSICRKCLHEEEREFAKVIEIALFGKEFNGVVHA